MPSPLDSHLVAALSPALRVSSWTLSATMNDE
ncbi:Uncharacterised protein [Mycobacterium tuberculosis]|uniref:Uncharacterized protein n=1 Tax=Mycobacterium tuberculosis TaxID=1773 RepID=A0A916PAE5_MYCTX|nr:Uncharacterised protein [Mycobacterium tuberculosis]COW37135.1 Uncharacterised protein [Mycobacterium tuberculosis]COW95986.1 Uncharacterised protein [Mycobacterium tuberculosis]